MVGHGFEPRSVLSHSLRSDLLCTDLYAQGLSFFTLSLHRSHGTEPGMVLTLGQGDGASWGWARMWDGEEEAVLVSIPEDIVQAEAGGMHTVCLQKWPGRSGWHQMGQDLGLGSLGKEL